MRRAYHGGRETDFISEASERKLCKQRLKLWWKYGTWVLMGKPESKPCRPGEILTSQWVLRIKGDDVGKVLCYSARRVTHGFKLRAGLEYNKTYSIVVHIPIATGCLRYMIIDLR